MTTKSINKFFCSFFIAMIAVAIPGAGLATKVVHTNLVKLTNDATRIFLGACLSVSEKTEPYEGTQFTYTEYTFEVFEALKGDMGNRITIKQFGRRAGLGSITGMPSYEPNQNYLLFLNDDSHLGLTTPVGLFQGAFAVGESQEGELMMINSINNLGLFVEPESRKTIQLRGLNNKQQKLMSNRAGPLNYQTFKAIVRKLIK